MTQERIEAYEKIRKALTEAPLLLMPYWNIPFKFYIDSCGDGLGAALHQVQIIDDKPTVGPVCYIARQLQPTEAKWSAYVWYGHLRNYTIILMELHILGWQKAIQEYRGNMTIVHKAGNIQKNADGLSRWALANTPDNPAYVPLEE
ncbi:hypothetical protein O181_048957 [Austropuccinia psidii MF-1]|uniref:Reverse transcriptase/retrotransposon-derived protein RNase H-like domain-containing protein n=1 Tax=Austropuccinia psidii MF-1 TaxID=1389203 RepID=A0A9Q3DW19_9BASI|nr:hypothetical protein [Austropuccinia psidii MF-1]